MLNRTGRYQLSFHRIRTRHSNGTGATEASGTLTAQVCEKARKDGRTGTNQSGLHFLPWRDFARRSRSRRASDSPRVRAASQEQNAGGSGSEVKLKFYWCLASAGVTFTATVRIDHTHSRCSGAFRTPARILLPETGPPARGRGRQGDASQRSAPH